MNERILLTGIPGTGKTKLGDYLRDHYGYDHIDMEISWNSNSLPRESEDKFKQFVMPYMRNKTVITWGFPVWLTTYIQHLENNGFRHIFLDGNRAVALGMFMEREEGNEKMRRAFYDQIRQIDESEITRKLKPVVYDPFTQQAEFKAIEVRAEEILKL